MQRIARARNLAARHWQLVAAHSHPAAHHVVEREVEKDKLAEYTGLRTAPTSIPPTSDVFVRGVKIPSKPKPPESDECCMSGCAVCVYDLYLASLEEYNESLRTARTELKRLSVPDTEWPNHIRDSKPDEGLDPSTQAFLALEKQLGKKHTIART